jgi:hypothetical protein
VVAFAAGRGREGILRKAKRQKAEDGQKEAKEKEEVMDDLMERIRNLLRAIDGLWKW